MQQTDIDKLTYAHIDTFYRELKQIYFDFDSYPKLAQYALFDLIFNLGNTKLNAGFPTLKKLYWHIHGQLQRKRQIENRRYRQKGINLSKTFSTKPRIKPPVALVAMRAYWPIFFNYRD